MSKAGQRAIEIGRDRLAEQIRKEANPEYSTIPDSRSISRRIEDAVIEIPDANFSHLLEYLARENGMPIKSFRKRFRQNMQLFRKVFCETKDTMQLKIEHRKVERR